jgi:hypothetical protein
MPPQVACGCRVGRAQVSPNLSTIPTFPFACFGDTSEDVDTSAFNIADGWDWPEEGIDWCRPVFHQPFYN